MPTAPLEVVTVDASVVARLMGVAAPTPGLRRQVQSGAVLLFIGPGRGEAGGGSYELEAEYGSPNVAAALANWLWSQLHGHVSVLRVAGEEVPLQHAAIKEALLAAAG